MEQERKTCWVDRLPTPQSGQLDHKAKGKFPGLAIRCFAARADGSRGRKVWFMRARMAGDKGAPKFVSLGEYPAVSEHDAERAAAEARDQLRKGIDPNAQRREAQLAAKRSALSFGELVEEYLGTRGLYKGKPLRPATLRSYSNCLRGKWFKDWKDRPLSAIDQREIDALVNRIPETASYSPLSALRAAMRHALHARYISAMPSIKLARPDTDKAPMLDYHEGEEAEIDLSELCIVLDALDELQRDFPLSPWPAIWTFQCLTGARSSAVLGAEWQQFDLGAAPTWRMPASLSKLKRAINIPLSEAAAALLRSLPRKPEGLVWPATRNGVARRQYPADQVARIEAALRARGYDKTFAPGRFRDTVATWLESRENASERAKCLLLDHVARADRGMRGEHYAQVMSERLARKLANEWAAAVATARADARGAADVVVQHPAALRAVAA